MKKFLLFIALCVCFSGLKAQSWIYHPFPATDALWRENYGDISCNCCEDYQLTITGDTTVGGFTYHKMRWAGFISGGPNTAMGINPSFWGCSGPSWAYTYTTTSIYYYGAFREDVPGKKVYFLPADSVSDTLLYDFNLSVGDTLPEMYQYSNAFGYYSGVKSIDSVLVGGVYHKRFNIYTIGSSAPPFVSIIEGVGSTNGFLGSMYPDFESHGELLCFSASADTETYPDGVSCERLSAGIADNSGFENAVSVFPNPGNGNYKVRIENAKDVTLEVSSLLGNCILKMNMKNDLAEIDLSDQPQGIYFIRISDARGDRITKKLVKQ